MTQIYQERLPNGLWLLAEPVPAAGSLAMTMLLPAGAAAEPQGQQGVSAVLSEMLFRGAGGLSAREHSDALDRLGVQRDTSVETRHLRLSATMIGSKLDEALPLLLDMASRPNLGEESLEPSRDLCLQEIDALEDEPQERCVLELRERHFPAPLGRSPLGKRDDLESLSLEQVRDFQRLACVPDGAILAFAGRFDWDRLRERVSRQFEGWQGGLTMPQPTTQAQRGYHHLKAETSQVHLALAYDAVAETHPDSVLQKAAAAVLSGGMSGRLFTEVREKRGLCYAVYAAYLGQEDRGSMLGYAGTTTPRAQETLDVMTAELRKLSEGVNASEFERAIVGMKSCVVMQGESTSARAASIARDQSLRGHPRTLEEIAAEVDSVTLEKLERFVREHPAGEMTIVTIGPAALRA